MSPTSAVTISTNFDISIFFGFFTKESKYCIIETTEFKMLHEMHKKRHEMHFAGVATCYDGTKKPQCWQKHIGLKTCASVQFIPLQ